MFMEWCMKIEEMWCLWQKFLDDYFCFEDWFKLVERMVVCLNFLEVLYMSVKEELKRFEVFQWQIYEWFIQLEFINKQYWWLVWENCIDMVSRLKQMVYEGNQCWDNFQRWVIVVLWRFRYFINQREEFEGIRESILVWFIEMDLQLINVEYFLESDVDDKMC